MTTLRRRSAQQDDARVYQCPACYGTGAVDLYRELQIERLRSRRMADGMAVLADYAYGCASRTTPTDKSRCLRLVADALMAQIEDRDEGPIEAATRDIDLRHHGAD